MENLVLREILVNWMDFYFRRSTLQTVIDKHMCPS